MKWNRKSVVWLLAAVFAGLWGDVSLAQAPKSGLPRLASPQAAGVEVLDIRFFEELARSLPERGGWLPVYVELRAAAARVEKVPLWSAVSNHAGASFTLEKEVEVAPGAPVRTWLYLRVAPGGDSHTATLRLGDVGDGAFVERSWQINSFSSAESISILVVGEQLGDVTPWPGQLVLDAEARGRRNRSGDVRAVEATVESCSVKKLPDSVLGYDAVDLVVLRDLGQAGLEAAQVEALRSWVYLGGSVVVVPARGSEAIFRSRLVRELAGKALVEPEVEEEFVPQDLILWPPAAQAAVSHAYARKEDASPGEGRSYRRVDPVVKFEEDGAIRREIHSTGGVDGTVDRKRLYVELPYGRGSLGILSIDDQKYRDEKSMAFLQALWQPIVEPRINAGTSSFQARATKVVADDIAKVLRDPSRDIGLPFLIGLIVIYLLLVGPGLYFFLKRKNRLPALVWVEPLLAALYVGVVFATTYLTKGVLTKTQLWTVFSQREGEALAVRESYLSIFAAAEGSYGIRSARGAFLNPIFTNEREAETQLKKMTQTASAAGLSLSGYELQLWQQGYALNGEVVDFGATGVGVEIQGTESVKGANGVEEGAQAIVAAVTNNLPFPLRSGLLFDAGRETLVPRLLPRQRVEVSFAGARGAGKGQEALDRKAAGWTEELLNSVRSLAEEGLGGRGRLRLVALLDRDVEDFKVDRPSTLKDRKDVYVLFAASESPK